MSAGPSRQTSLQSIGSSKQNSSRLLSPDAIGAKPFTTPPPRALSLPRSSNGDFTTVSRDRESVVRGDAAVSSSQLGSKSSSSIWAVIEPIPPCPLLDVDDIMLEVLSWCTFPSKLAMRLVSTTCQAQVDEHLNMTMLLATLKSKRRGIFGGIKKRQKSNSLFRRFGSDVLTDDVSNTSSDSSTENSSGSSSSSHDDESIDLDALMCDNDNDARPTARAEPKTPKIVHRCMKMVEKEIEAFDFVEESMEVVNSERYDNTSVVVAAIESERCFPIMGFVKRMLPGDPPSWVYLPDGKKTPVKGNNLNNIECPCGYQWASPWEIFIDEALCNPTDGWSYSLGFSAGRFGPKPVPFVRRREWRRVMVVDPDAMTIIAQEAKRKARELS